ncbi:MAG: 4'-phosphopantetheinyl transferase superfamily protein [Flavobacteriaceae bacterium]|nr:4'-phosphopantetheinyl transferase superfamily protein [Flavobacteriaceae bacterium]
MPLYKTITINKNTKALIWKVEESLEALSEGISLSGHCQKRIDLMKSELHKRAFMSIRHLMALEGFSDHDLYYDEKGKPHLKCEKHISISHSFEFTAIIISSDSEVGIDVEKQRPKILKIAHRFTPIQEYRTLANDSAIIRKLTLVWCAKEALYKIVAHKGLSFLHHIDVADFSLGEDDTTTAIVSYEGNLSNYIIAFIEFEDFACVYALQN